MDRADGSATAELFTPDGMMVVHREDATERHTGRQAIAVLIDGLARYEWTRHLIVRHEVDPHGRAARTWCLAHHVGGAAGQGCDRLVDVRYEDRYDVVEGRLSFTERVVWLEKEVLVDASSAPPQRFHQGALGSSVRDQS